MQFDQTPNKKLELSTIPKTMECFHRLHERLKISYNNTNCGVIALELAKIMITEKKRPYMILVYEEMSSPPEISQDKTNFLFSSCRTTITKLTPLPYAGKVEPWYAHSVICLDGWAFDPILDAPVLLTDYTKTLFGKDVSTKTQMASEEVKARVEI